MEEAVKTIDGDPSLKISREAGVGEGEPKFTMTISFKTRFLTTREAANLNSWAQWMVMDLNLRKVKLLPK
jgi:hypothetical protein